MRTDLCPQRSSYFFSDFYRKTLDWVIATRPPLSKLPCFVVYPCLSIFDLH